MTTMTSLISMFSPPSGSSYLEDMSSVFISVVLSCLLQYNYGLDTAVGRTGVQIIEVFSVDTCHSTFKCSPCTVIDT